MRCTRFVSVVFILACTMNVTAQDRMPPIAEDQMTEEQRLAVEEFKQARDTTRFGGAVRPASEKPGDVEPGQECW